MENKHVNPLEHWKQLQKDERLIQWSKQECKNWILNFFRIPLDVHSVYDYCFEGDSFERGTNFSRHVHDRMFSTNGTTQNSVHSIRTLKQLFMSTNRNENTLRETDTRRGYKHKTEDLNSVLSSNYGLLIEEKIKEWLTNFSNVKYVESPFGLSNGSHSLEIQNPVWIRGKCDAIIESGFIRGFSIEKDNSNFIPGLTPVKIRVQAQSVQLLVEIKSSFSKGLSTSYYMPPRHYIQMQLYMYLSMVKGENVLKHGLYIQHTPYGMVWRLVQYDGKFMSRFISTLSNNCSLTSEYVKNYHFSQRDNNTPTSFNFQRDLQFIDMKSLFGSQRYNQHVLLSFAYNLEKVPDLLQSSQLAVEHNDRVFTYIRGGKEFLDTLFVQGFDSITSSQSQQSLKKFTNT